MRKLCLFVFLALAGCEAEQQAEIPEIPVRAIKYLTIGDVAQAEQRVLAGVVEAGTSSNVAFEIGGRVVEFTVKVGETVAPGQIIAQLDPESYLLQAQQAELSVKQAMATEKDAMEKYQQQTQLWTNRLTTKTALDTATSNLSNAKGQTGIARSQLEVKMRDLKKTRLIAPFGGRVAERLVEVYEEVSPGQAILALQTEGEDEVAVSVPETLVSQIRVGQEVSVAFPPLDGETATGVVSEIAPRAGDGNAYPASVRLVSPPAGLRAGMSAEIRLTFATGSTGSAFTVPVGALKGRVEGRSQGVVYVYDPEEKVLRERPVQVVGVEGNTPQIVGEIAPGDIIATAGVGHMYDGMKVRLLDPENPF